MAMGCTTTTNSRNNNSSNHHTVLRTCRNKQGYSNEIRQNICRCKDLMNGSYEKFFDSVRVSIKILVLIVTILKLSQIFFELLKIPKSFKIVSFKYVSRQNWKLIQFSNLCPLGRKMAFNLKTKTDKLDLFFWLPIISVAYRSLDNNVASDINLSTNFSAAFFIVKNGHYEPFSAVLKW